MDLKKIAGYEIIGTIGQGGMGIVYRARDLTLDREVAIKVILPAALGAEARQRFIREAKACSRISHPHIVTVYAAGEDAGTPYLAMELLRGETMRAILERGPVPWERATGWVIGILDALSRLHAEGIIHRDLKPENIIVTTDDIAKLTDFGIARLKASETITVDGATLGTVRYMSPEQVQGRKVDPRSDLFSMGSVLYELIAGEPAFTGEHPLAAMYAITNEAPRPLAECAPDAPAGLAAAVSRALEKDPSARYQDAGEFRDALRAVSGAKPEPAPAGGDGRPRSLLRKIALPAAVVAAAAVAVVALMNLRGGAGGDREFAKRHYRNADSLRMEGSVSEAKIEYQNAIIADRRWEEPWNSLAMLALGENDLAKADSLLGRALAINPNHPAALCNLGTVRRDRGNYAGAEESYRRALASDSTFVLAYNNLGSLLIRLDRPAEAAALLDRGLAKARANPVPTELSISLLKHRGIAAEKLGRIDEARDAWRAALERAPGNAEIEALLSRVQ